MNKLNITLFLTVVFTVTACTGFRPVSDLPSGDIETHLGFLASDDLQGRYPGTEGDLAASKYIEKYLQLIGLETNRQEFSFIKSVRRGAGNYFLTDGRPVSEKEYSPFGFSADTLIDAAVVFAGYGMSVKADSFEWDDYKALDVKGKYVMAFRGYPRVPDAENNLAFASDDRDKAMMAADKGACGLLLVSGYNFDADDILVKVERKMASVSIPVFQISRSLADTILKKGNLSIKQAETVIAEENRSIHCEPGVFVEARSEIEDILGSTGNIFAVLKGSDPALDSEYIVIGAHYDHLGYGGPGSSSRRQETIAIHNGADDNASGVSMMLNLASRLTNRRREIKRSLIFAAFGAEEMGLLGSKYFVNHPPVDPEKIVAMINLDMVGRLDTARGVQLGGTGTSVEADSLITISNRENLKLRLSKEGSGPSDHSSFYGKNIPVFFITTGAHTDYHTPDDDTERINFDGMVAVSDFTENLVKSIDDLPHRLTFTEAGPRETANPGYRFKVTLGFMPDFSSTDIEGVRVDFVSKGKPAERGGIKNGDIITAIDGLKVKNIYDYMYRLGKLSKNQIISVEVIRNGNKEVFLIQL